MPGLRDTISPLSTLPYRHVIRYYFDMRL
jgi:hypothetical protein